MDYSRLKKQLRFDEGYRCEIYRDTKGFPTVGIGHKLTKNDIEWDTYSRLREGGKITISDQRINELYEQDKKIAENACKKIFYEFDKFCSELQEILVNIAFANGGAGFALYHRFIAAIHESDFKEAAKELEDSNWFRDRKLRDRVIRLMKRLQAL